MESVKPPKPVPIHPIEEMKTLSGSARAKSDQRAILILTSSFVHLDVEFKKEDVAVFDDVLFAFGAEEAGFFDGLFAAVFEEVG